MSRLTTANLPALQLLPAVDISEGYAVRPVGGTLSGGEQRLDPVVAALGWVNAGSSWIHLVDLDLAFGRGANTEVLAEVMSEVRTRASQQGVPVRVQISGGVRDAETLERALSLDPDRVNITSAALADGAWVEEAFQARPNLLALGLDARYDRERGWVTVARGTDWSGPGVTEALDWLESVGVQRYVVTDVSKDGSLAGPGAELLDEVLRLTEHPVVASGGVASLEDLERLRSMVPRGLEGVVLGKALYVGNFSFEQALEVASA